MATSKLQIEVGNLLDKTFPQFRIRENYRPDWLLSPNNTKLELDFYIEELKIAFEVQGIQHYKYTPYFQKEYSDFEKRKRYDDEKRNLCYGKGVKLIEVSSLIDAELAIDKIAESYQDEPNNITIGPKSKWFIEFIKQRNQQKIKNAIVKENALETLNKYGFNPKAKLYYGNDPALQELDLWRTISFRCFRKGNGCARDFRSHYISKGKVKEIRNKLSGVKQEEDIVQIFKEYF
jgi:hypothetical protein